MYLIIDNLNGGSVPCKSRLNSANGSANQYVDGNILLGEFGGKDSLCPNYEYRALPEVLDWSFLTTDIRDIVSGNTGNGVCTFVGTLSSGTLPATSGKIHVIDGAGTVTTFVVNFGATAGQADVFALYPFQTVGTRYMLYAHTGQNGQNANIGVLNVNNANPSLWTQNDTLYSGLVGSFLNEDTLAKTTSSRQYQIIKSVNNLIYIMTNSSIYSFTPSDSPVAGSFSLIYTVDSGWFIKSICDYKGFLVISIVSDVSGGMVPDTKIVLWDGLSNILDVKPYVIKGLGQPQLVTNGSEVYVIGKEYATSDNGLIYQFTENGFQQIFSHNRLDVLFPNDWTVWRGDIWFRANNFLAFIRNGVVHNMRYGARSATNNIRVVRNLRNKILYGDNTSSARRIQEMGGNRSGIFVSASQQLPANSKITRIKIFFEEPTNVTASETVQINVYNNTSSSWNSIEQIITYSMLNPFDLSFTIRKTLITSAPVIVVNWWTLTTAYDPLAVKRIEVEFEQLDII